MKSIVNCFKAFYAENSIFITLFRQGRSIAVSNFWKGRKVRATQGAVLFKREGSVHNIHLTESAAEI